MACQLILKHLQIRHAVACPYNIVRFGVLQHPPYCVVGCGRLGQDMVGLEWVTASVT